MALSYATLSFTDQAQDWSESILIDVLRSTTTAGKPESRFYEVKMCTQTPGHEVSDLSDFQSVGDGDKQIGLGVGANPSNLQQKWCGEGMPLFSDEEGMWIIPPFEPEPPEPPIGPTPPVGPGPTPPIVPPPVGPKPPDTKEADKIRRIRITGTVPVESWSDVFRSFVNPGQ